MGEWECLCNGLHSLFPFIAILLFQSRPFKFHTIARFIFFPVIVRVTWLDKLIRLMVLNFSQPVRGEAQTNETIHHPPSALLQFNLYCCVANLLHLSCIVNPCILAALFILEEMVYLLIGIWFYLCSFLCPSLTFVTNCIRTVTGYIYLTIVYLYNPRNKD